MNSLRRPLLALVTVVVTGAAWSACSDDEAPSSKGDAGAGAGGDSGTGLGGFSAFGGVGGGAMGGSAGTGGTGGLWKPTQDAGWTEIPWVDCGAMYANQPENAVPPLTWIPCEGNVPGCTRLLVTWDYGFPPLGTQGFAPSVFYVDGKLRLTLWLVIKGVGEVLASFDEAMKPIGVWRGSLTCKVFHAGWTSAHLCLAAGGVPPAEIALLPITKPYGPPLKTFKQTQDLVTECTATHLFTMDTAAEHWVRDLASDNLYHLGWSSGRAFDPRVHGTTALMQRYDGPPGAVILDGWVWTPPNTLAQLIDVFPDMIWDLRTDGTTLAWVRVAQNDLSTWQPGELWVSPMTTDAAKMQPKKLRDVPASSIAKSANGIGEGMFALIEPKHLEGAPLSDAPDHELHVYRLSDGKHWKLPRIPDLSPAAEPGYVSAPTEVLRVDAKEVWYFTKSQTSLTPWTIVRQRLDVLGPGD